MREKPNLSLGEYINFIKNEQLAKPVTPMGGIFLGECVSFKPQETVLFKKNP